MKYCDFRRQDEDNNFIRSGMLPDINEHYLHFLINLPDTEGNKLFCSYGLHQCIDLLKNAVSGNAERELSILSYLTDINRETIDIDDAKLKEIMFLLYKSGIGDITDGYKAYAESKKKLEIRNYNASNLAETVDTVNDKVDKLSNGKIKDLMKTNELAANSAAIINVVYFKGEWLDKFRKCDNKLKFTNHLSQASDVECIKGSADAYVYNDSFHGFCKSYADTNLSFYALMPKENTCAYNFGLFKNRNETKTTKESTKVKPFTQDDILKIRNLKRDNEAELKITMPKFKMDYKCSLKDTFKELGIKYIFEGGDFSKGFKNPAGKHVSKIESICGIELDENGTEAYGAVKVLISESICRKIDLVFDKPFFFMIYDEKNQIPVFMGILNNVK